MSFNLVRNLELARLWSYFLHKIINEVHQNVNNNYFAATLILFMHLFSHQ